ncbi:OmpH family outer membrane protein [Akkermansiaceae bacterium]|nr:OmpH family outer membrane protein [Akkermansiaceae bacterium]
MKNSFKRSIIFLTAAALLTASATAESLKVATVDVEALFKGYHKTAVEQKKISEEFARINKDNTDRQESMRAIETQLSDLRKKIEDPTIAEKLRTEAKNTFKTKLNEIKAIEQERKDSLGRRSKALEAQKFTSIQGIRNEIVKLVVEHSKTEAYDYVFDKSGVSQNQLPFLVYTKGTLDITDEIMVKLNKDAPAKK